jgi:plasmid stabilization system protein ParE
MAAPYRIIISPEASANIQAIYDYIAEESPDNAAGMVNRLLRSIDLLATVPKRTIAELRQADLKKPVRTVPVRPYLVYVPSGRGGKGRTDSRGAPRRAA